MSAVHFEVAELQPENARSHGRDNKIHVFPFAEDVTPSYQAIPSPAQPTNLKPLYTIETNALGYCKCSLLELEGEEALVAVPATLHDDLVRFKACYCHEHEANIALQVDIFHLPSGKRIFRSVGKECFNSKTGKSCIPPAESSLSVLALGTMMALTLDFQDAHTLRLITAYEDGRVAAFLYTQEGSDWSTAVMGEGEGWAKVFESREHKEPGKFASLSRRCIYL